MPCLFSKSGIVCTTFDFNPGDQAPKGYLEWHEWADVQHKAGLRQKECGRCGKWKYPQELSTQYDRLDAQLCNECAKGEKSCPT